MLSVFFSQSTMEPSTFQYFVTGRVADDSPVFYDVEIGTFKCHISLRVNKNELHDLRRSICLVVVILSPGPTPRKQGADPYPSNA